LYQKNNYKAQVKNAQIKKETKKNGLITTDPPIQESLQLLVPQVQYDVYVDKDPTVWLFLLQVQLLAPLFKYPQPFTMLYALLPFSVVSV